MKTEETKIYLASDHAGFGLKEKVKEYLISSGYEVEDSGAFTFNSEDDYPDFVEKAARKVAEDAGSKGIVFGKSGGGEAIVANKIKGIRAGFGFSRENVELLRAHNNANILALGSAFVGEEEARELVAVFLETPFSNEERHKRRIEKIKTIENQ